MIEYVIVLIKIIILSIIYTSVLFGLLVRINNPDPKISVNTLNGVRESFKDWWRDDREQVGRAIGTIYGCMLFFSILTVLII